MTVVTGFRAVLIHGLRFIVFIFLESQALFDLVSVYFAGNLITSSDLNDLGVG
ncbi:hypothetical protein AAVH_24219, partial [Aphelenchoides avenae]